MCQRDSGNRQIGVACGNCLKRLKLKCFSSGDLTCFQNHDVGYKYQPNFFCDVVLSSVLILFSTQPS